MATNDLHYLALEPEHRANALRAQLREAFRPYRVFLAQALAGAEVRQATAIVNWSPANARRFRLEATTTDVELVADVGLVVKGLSVDEPLDLDEHFYRPTDQRYFRPEKLARSGAAVRVEFGADAPSVGDSLKWKGTTVQLEQAPEATRPADLTIKKRSQPVLREWDDEGCLFVRVDGLHEADNIEAPAGWTVRAARRSEPAGLKVTDEKRVAYLLGEGNSISLPRGEPAGDVHDERGTVFRPVEEKSGRRDANWIRLDLDDERDREGGVDPRNAFFDSDENEIWAINPKDIRRHSIRRPKSRDDILKVKERDRDRFELRLERAPAEDRKLLCLPLDTRQLKQRQAVVYRLQDAPLEHHRALLRLFERPEKVFFPRPPTEEEPQWRVLADLERSGTEQQRLFVRKALATPDFAVLEGPPGSGKTTAICELVVQCLARGERVLLCATTNFAIDNVLERLSDEARFPDVFPLRIGRPEKIDAKIEQFGLDARVSALETALRKVKTLPEGIDLAATAQRTVLDAANLICGTTTGLLSHPWLRANDRDAAGHRLGQPYFDVMIIDEASKTTVPEFLVPAAYARKWIIVGDKRQLSPFADRSDLVANLAQAQIDESVTPRAVPNPKPRRLSAELQRASHLLFELAELSRKGVDVRWLVIESAGVIDAVWAELDAVSRKTDEDTKWPHGLCVRIADRATDRNDGSRLRQVEVQDLERGNVRALAVVAANMVLVPTHLLDRVWRFLPADAAIAPRSSGLPETFDFRHAHFRGTPLRRPISIRDKTLKNVRDVANFVAGRLSETTWAAELAWRLIRQHEVGAQRTGKEAERLGQEVARLTPVTESIGHAIESLQQIALPSIIESLQEGVRSSLARRDSVLGLGFETNEASQRMKQTWTQRFEPLTFQHRMHPDIAAFPRARFYDAERLENANTIEIRDAGLGWSPVWIEPPPARSCWLDVEGRENRGRNADEVEAIRVKLAEFLEWAQRNPPQQRDDEPKWQVGILSFYLGQQEALAEMLRKLTKSDRRLRFETTNVELVCGTVDRFQGREADLVFLSFRNTGRKGFLDSLNRLNVGLTRARQQLVLVGNKQYWQGTKHRVDELTALGAEPSWVGAARLQGRVRR